MSENEKRDVTKKVPITQFMRVSFFIFAILFVGSVSVGFSPAGVQEINNAFFSLFIHDPRTQSDTLPQVTLTSVDGERDTISVIAPYAQPIHLSIPKIALTTKILSPQSTDAAVLDNALLNGAVMYPGSGSLESKTNIFIFGHSSGLPVVHNQNFKIFNNLKLLSLGDSVSVYSDEREYRYKVTSVRLALSDEVRVTFSNDHKLILSTCNTFGAKEERYVVEASFVDSRSVSNYN